MSEKRYKVTGRVAAPFSVLEGRAVGDVFSADIDKETENALVGAGALEVLPQPKRETKKIDTKSEAKK